MAMWGKYDYRATRPRPSPVSTCCPAAPACHLALISVERTHYTRAAGDPRSTCLGEHKTLTRGAHTQAQPLDAALNNRKTRA